MPSHRLAAACPVVLTTADLRACYLSPARRASVLFRAGPLVFSLSPATCSLPSAASPPSDLLLPAQPLCAAHRVPLTYTLLWPGHLRRPANAPRPLHRRAWFLCPQCAARAAALYLPDPSPAARLRCRRCSGLRYPSDSRAPGSAWDYRAATGFPVPVDADRLAAVADRLPPARLARALPVWLRWTEGGRGQRAEQWRGERLP